MNKKTRLEVSPNHVIEINQQMRQITGQKKAAEFAAFEEQLMS